jgi:RNA polymerase subunit RPABC4/transcription elongation factor Spt4
VQQTLVCNRCGTQNPWGQQFCGACGAKLFSGVQQQSYGTQQVYSCPSCGQLVAHGLKFCGSCGTPLNWPGQQQMQAPPPYQQQPQGLSQQTQYNVKPTKTKAGLVLSIHTILPSEEVILRAVQYFTGEKWRTQTQSARIATFRGRPPIPIGSIIVMIIFVETIIIPIIMYIIIIRKAMRFQNIVVTANPIAQGSEVVITYPSHAKKMASKFLDLLPTSR